MAENKHCWEFLLFSTISSQTCTVSCITTSGLLACTLCISKG